MNYDIDCNNTDVIDNKNETENIEKDKLRKKKRKWKQLVKDYNELNYIQFAEKNTPDVGCFAIIAFVYLLMFRLIFSFYGLFLIICCIALNN